MALLVHTDGGLNNSAARADWLTKSIDPAVAYLLQGGSDAFLHQSLFSPCVSTIACAQDIWIEHIDGYRHMDFHGNSVYHIDYDHSRMIAARIGRQGLDAYDDSVIAHYSHEKKPTAARADLMWALENVAGTIRANA